MIAVAVGQFCARENIAANLLTCIDLIERAAEYGARLVVLPEASLCPPPGIFDPTPVAQPSDGPFARAIADVACRLSLSVVFGMFTPAPDGRIFNTVVAIGPSGTEIARYDKLHLYDAFSVRESDQVRPGPAPGSPSAIATFAVDGMTFGIATCYDLRFPEQFRALLDLGAEAIVLPAAWIAGPLKQVHWSTLTRARAIESSVYIIAADQTPPTAIGHSAVIDPNGAILAQAGENQTVVVASLTSDHVQHVRSQNPSVYNRRFSVKLRNIQVVGGAG